MLWGAIVQFVGAAICIMGAGVLLTRSADVIAERTGWGRLFVGGIFLAAATSLPELATDVHAVRIGMSDLALGDLIGSSLFNLLILAIADLAHKKRGAMLSRISAAHALSGTVAIAMTALVAIGVLFGRKLEGVAFLGVGPFTWSVLAAYLIGIRMIFFDQRAAREAEQVAETAEPTGRMSLPTAIAGYLAGALVVFVAAPFLARSGGKIAEVSGLGGTFVGTTLVAFSTSLPELVSTLVAARMGAYELAIGNVFGSNAFNMVLLAPLDAVHSGPILAAVSETHGLTCLCVILITSVVILGQLYRVERRILFLEPDATLVIGLVFVALWMAYVAG